MSNSLSHRSCPQKSSIDSTECANASSVKPGPTSGEDDLVVLHDLSQRAAIAAERTRIVRELRQADSRKDEFLAMLGHELRNPLAPLRNALALSRLGPLDSDTIDLMERQVEQLVRLVDDLLDVSRIMQGKIELRREPIDLATVVRRAVETTQPAVDAAGQKLAVVLPSTPVWVNGDLVRLTEVVTNLLNNAAKYSTSGGRISLTVERESEDIATLRVRDTGIGIAVEMLPQIFELFKQAECSLDYAQGGLGIGLALVRNLVELHGGAVSATSGGVGKGSEFTVRLPTLPQGPQALIAPEFHPARSRNLRVLVVEDMVGSARVFAKMLSRFWGHTVEVAHDGASALDAARSFHPELILLDIGLPGMNGYEVARRLRQQPEFSGTLLVALTGYGQEGDLRRSAEAGFDEHVTKPPSVQMLERLFMHPKLSGD